ncbi:MAG: LysM peptidoglycan-binding domain-containing protein [Bacteroidetes bacterium]|nr:LysM peptidoglycan-binding domain-containing protein [Bacteroidota bacterium]
MMRVFVFFFCVLVAGFSEAQTPLTVQGVTPKLYLEHKVAPKENWYSVGRLYNVSPKELAPFNGLTMDKPLSIGQELKVPLTATNFSQNGAKAADEVFVPVYHTVQEKEWMYRLSVNYNKVPFANLEKWNGLPHGAVLKPGMQMVVGYLKVKTGQSALASKGSAKIPVATAPPAVATTTEPAATKKPEEKKLEPVTVKPEPVTTPKQEPVVKNDPPPAPKTETPKEQPVSQPPAQQTPKPVTTTQPVNNAPDNKGGYFKSSYTDGYKSSSGNAGVFKSTSGWNDGKYYALMNNVGVGSIVKVSTPSNGKTIYAKVLGSLPDMKESAGLTIRISDAAAAELGANAQKFGVEVKY